MSDKTEFNEHTDVGKLLQNNLIENIDNKIKNTDLVELYNAILMDNQKPNSVPYCIANKFFDIIQCFVVKCSQFGYLEETTTIMKILMTIDKLGFNCSKYFALDLLVYVINIEFKEKPKTRSYENLYI